MLPSKEDVSFWLARGLETRGELTGEEHGVARRSFGGPDCVGRADEELVHVYSHVSRRVQLIVIHLRQAKQRETPAFRRGQRQPCRRVSHPRVDKQHPRAVLSNTV